MLKTPTPKSNVPLLEYNHKSFKSLLNVGALILSIAGNSERVG
jgi:hypothetical protein